MESLSQLYSAVVGAPADQQKLECIHLRLPSQFNGVFSAPNTFLTRMVASLTGDASVSLMAFLSVLKRIEKDTTFDGIVMLSISSMDMIKFNEVQMLRSQVAAIVQSGKRVITFSDNYSTKAYYFASACSQIFLLPAGTLYTVGLASYNVYLRKALEMIGVKFEAIAVSDYKTASDYLTKFEETDEAKAQSDWILDSMFDIIVDGIAEGRGMQKEDVKEMINNAPYSAPKAKDLGFVDEVCNEEDWAQVLNISKVTQWHEVGKRMKPLAGPAEKSKYIAVVYASGMITYGNSSGGFQDIPLPMISESFIGADTVKAKIRQMYVDDKCAGMILYVDSPGGLATASESIAATLRQFAEKKPLVCYMGGVAASGGYYIASAADYIIAQPGTITGSIGVIMGKPAVQDLFNKLNLNGVLHKRGENAEVAAPIPGEGFSDKQKKIFTGIITDLYKTFIDRVVDGMKRRGLSEEQQKDVVDNRTEGRVWTGQQALEYGLVDELGDFYKAIDKVKEMAEVGDVPTIVINESRPIAVQFAEQNPVVLMKHIQTGVKCLTSGPQFIMPYTFSIN